MRFVVDENLPDVLCDFIERHGHDVVHVRQWLRAGVPDPHIWARAREEERVIVTKDRDFLTMRMVSQDEYPRVLFLYLGNQPNRALLADVEHSWAAIEARLLAQERLAFIHRAVSPERFSS